MSRYRFVSTMKAEGFAVTAACEAAEVSTSAYWGWHGLTDIHQEARSAGEDVHHGDHGAEQAP